MLGLHSHVTHDKIFQDLVTFTAPSHSIALDGTGDYLSIAQQSLNISSFGNNISISFWAKRTDNTSGEAVILGFANAGGTGSPSTGTSSWSRLNFDSDGDLLKIESDHNGEYAEMDITANTNWHHYVITSRGKGSASGTTEAEVIMYEDGSAVSTTNENFGNVDGKQFTFDRIGADVATGGTTEFKGLLHQLAIWSEVLDDVAVTAIYNSGAPIPLQTNSGNYINSGQLKHLWKFSENTGTTTADEIGGITGTFVGNTAFSTDIPS